MAGHSYTTRIQILTHEIIQLSNNQFLASGFVKIFKRQGTVF